MVMVVLMVLLVALVLTFVEVVLVLSDGDIKVGTCWKINRGGGCLVGRVDK